MDVADAVRMGSASLQNSKTDRSNERNYFRWKEKMQKEIDKLNGIEEPNTFWERLKKRKRKIS